MKEYLSIIEQSGKKILCANHQEASPEELLEQIKQSEEIILKMNNPELLLLIDIRNCDLTEDAVNQFKDTAQKIKNFRQRTAVIGVSGIRKLLLISINKFTGIEAKAFDDESSAKNWLVQ